MVGEASLPFFLTERFSHQPHLTVDRGKNPSLFGL
jgi:hypothetical protein